MCGEFAVGNVSVKNLQWEMCVCGEFAVGNVSVRNLQ